MVGASLTAQACERGDCVLRPGAVTVDPDSDGDDINLPGVPTLKTQVGDDTRFGIIPMYMVTENVGDVNFKTQIDPFVYHIGIVHRF